MTLKEILINEKLYNPIERLKLSGFVDKFEYIDEVVSVDKKGLVFEKDAKLILDQVSTDNSKNIQKAISTFCKDNNIACFRHDFDFASDFFYYSANDLKRHQSSRTLVFIQSDNVMTGDLLYHALNQDKNAHPKTILLNETTTHGQKWITKEKFISLVENLIQIHKGVLIPTLAHGYSEMRGQESTDKLPITYDPVNLEAMRHPVINFTEISPHEEFFCDIIGHNSSIPAGEWAKMEVSRILNKKP